jgi:hypothetical protein
MPTRPNRKSQSEAGGVLRDILTFERLLTGPVVHLIYWGGLGIILVGAFFGIGAAVGVAWKEQELVGKLLAIPVAVVGALFSAALILLWRSFCELYVAVFQIADDLKGLRAAAEREVGPAPRVTPPPQRPLP